MLRRLREKNINFPDYSAVKRWIFIVLLFVAVALIWIFYFIYVEYLGADKVKLSGVVYYKERPLSGVSVSIDDEETVTDEEGNFVVSNISFGDEDLIVSKDHFLPVKKNIFIWRKNFRLGKINLERDPQYSAYLSGIVLNNFNKKPVGNAIVYLNDANKTTDENGFFEFEDVPKGEVKLKISALDFYDKETDIILGEGGNIDTEYFLTPYGKISFTSAREGIKNIYSINYDGTDLKNLTSEIKEDSWGGKFTYDSKKIVFYSTYEKDFSQWGQKIAHLYYMDLEKKEIRKISEDVVPEGDFIISKDNQRVVFLGKEKGKETPEIYISGIGTNKEWRKITDNSAYESSIDISPDGSQILYSAFIDGLRDIYMVDTNTYKEKRITKSKDYEFSPLFSPDGKEILYVREDFDFSSKIFVYNILTEKEKEIYKTSLDLKNVIWNKDGKKILFVSLRDKKTNIYVIDGDGKNEVKLTSESADYSNIVWPSVEKILVFTISDADGAVLAVMDLSSRSIFELEEVTSDKISWAER